MKTETGANPLVKVVLTLDPGEWHGCETETLWAEEIGGNRYRLRNTPFYAFGVSAEDVVFAQADREARLVFAGVAYRGGHSTYRVMRSEHCDDKSFEGSWEPLKRLGCSYEGGPSRLLAVDVPPRAEIYTVYDFLERGETSGAWHFEEGHCGHPVRNQSRG